MSIVKMRRLRLLGLSSERDELLKELMAMGCVELTEAAEAYAGEDCGPLRREESRAAEYRAQSQRYASALAILDKYAPRKTGLFAALRPVRPSEIFDDDMTERANLAADGIAALAAEISGLHGEENRLRTLITSLEPWLACDLPLEMRGTAGTNLVFCTLPQQVKLEEAESALTAAADAAQLFSVSLDRDARYCVLVAHKAVWDAAMEAMRPFGLQPAALDGIQGTARQNTDACRRELDRIGAEIGEKTAQIAAYGGDRELLQTAYDRSEQDQQRELAREKLMTTGTVISLAGWAPAAEEKNITALLDKLCVAYEFSDPQEGDNVPVQLKSNAVTRPLNMVTEMYSLPAYGNVDPNPLIMPFFTIFFGIMYADLGYGIVLLILGILGSRLIHRSGTIKYMTGLLIECGITTAIFGLLFGSCFGDAINYIPALSFLEKIPIWAWKDPTQDPMWFMYASLAVGAVHLLTGMVIHLCLEIRDGRPLEGIFDVVPWWITFAGIGMGALGKGWTVLIVGVASLILTQGRHKKGIFGKLMGGITSLYDITSWLGDILSYTRLMALMLAGSVIAQVFNMLGSLPGSVLFFILIFIVGHAFNMGINIIGTYVHAARLQYLEFFGKFYEDGGKPFKPLAYKTKYTQIIKEEQ